MTMFCRAAPVIAMVVVIAGVACAQIIPPGTTSVQIIDYKTTPAIVGALSNGPSCYIYAQHPGSGQVQVACRLPDNTLVFNGVMTILTNLAFTCYAVSPSFNVAWAFVPDALPAIKFQIAASATGTGPPLFFAAPIFSSPGVAALGGIF